MYVRIVIYRVVQSLLTVDVEHVASTIKRLLHPSVYARAYVHVYACLWSKFHTAIHTPFLISYIR